MTDLVLSSVSLSALVVTIILAFLTHTNAGVLAFAMTLLVGLLTGLPQADLVGGFNVSLFVILLGSAFFFNIAHLNGTLHLLARKTVALSGKRAWAVPFCMYFVGLLLAAVGPGTIAAIGVTSMFGFPLAMAMKASPLMIGLIAQLGTVAGGIVPWAPTGIVGIAKSAEAGYASHIALPLFINTTLATFFFAVLLFVAYRGWNISPGDIHDDDPIPGFDRKQKLTLLAVVVMVICVIGFKTHIGLTCFLLGCALNLMGVADMEDCLKAVPWGIILIVIGVGMLMHVVIKAGGIELLASLMARVMTPDTASALISVVAGMMSWFSSTSGVVMPTLIPTIPNILANFGEAGTHIPPALMVSAITVGSSLAGLSPASTGGGMLFAAISNGYLKLGQPCDNNRLFMLMFAISVIALVVSALYAYLGGYSLTPYGL